jgi:hypothetical protein
MGIGMVVVCDAKSATEIGMHLGDCHKMGIVVSGRGEVLIRNTHDE